MCENLISNVTHVKDSQFELYFMDGPFFIECKKTNDQVLLQFINNRKNRVVEHEYEITSDELISLIYKTSHRLIWLFEQKNHQKIRDIEELKKLLKVLSQ